MSSLDLSLAWLPRVLDSSAVALLAVQDGMTPEQVRPYLNSRVGIFVGGSTDDADPLGGWKLRTLDSWCALGRETGCWVHVARVNSMQRIYACSAAGAHSFDGSNASRFSKNTPKLDRARRQLSIYSNGSERM